MTTNQILTPAQEFFIEEFLKTNFDTAPAKLFKFMRLCVESQKSDTFNMVQWMTVDDTPCYSPSVYFATANALKAENKNPVCGTSACIAGEMTLTLATLPKDNIHVVNAMAHLRNLCNEDDLDQLVNSKNPKYFRASEFLYSIDLAEQCMYELLENGRNSIIHSDEVRYIPAVIIMRTASNKLMRTASNKLMRIEHTFAENIVYIIENITVSAALYGRCELKDVSKEDAINVLGWIETTIGELSWEAFHQQHVNYAKYFDDGGDKYDENYPEIYKVFDIANI